MTCTYGFCAHPLCTYTLWFLGGLLVGYILTEIFRR